MSGRGTVQDGIETGNAALSLAITIGGRRPFEDNTIYVRDQDGNIFGHVESTRFGTSRCVRREP